MDTDHLSRLPVDVFIKEITYLPFDNVIAICTSNTTLHNYCTDVKYNNKWRKLIDDTFGGIYNYQKHLEDIREKLNVGEGVYNYLVYSHLVKVLDPITQLMIYYRQGDMDSFDSPNYNNNQRFLALFLLNRKNKMKNYLPDDDYLSFISMLEGQKIDQNILNNMLVEMAKEGSVQGVFMMSSKGANIHAEDDNALRWASQLGQLEVVRYLIENKADVHANDDWALRWTSRNGHLEVVKYLVERGADIHAQDDYALRWASRNGHLEVVKYLTEHGADVHAQDDYALRLASHNGHLEVVKYLIEKGANIHARGDEALRWASIKGHLDVVEYLESLQ